MPKTQRSLRPSDIDTARGMAILLVVYAHGLAMFFLGNTPPADAAFLQWQFLASCGMPFFFIVSGLVYRVKTHRKAFTSSLTFLLLAYACHVVGWLISSLEHGISLRALVVPLVITGGLTPIAMWFLVVMAFIQLIYHFYERSKTGTKLLIALAVVALYAASVATRHNPFAVGAWAPGLLFLASGHALGKSRWLSREPVGNAQRWVLVAALMVATAALAPLNLGCLLDPVAMCPHPNGTFSVYLMDGSLGFLPLFLLSAVVGSYAFWLLARQLGGNSAWIGAKLAQLGKHSLALFTLNAFVLSFVEPNLQRFLPEQIPLWLIIAGPIGLCIAQVAALPWWRPLNDPLLKSSGRAAKLVVDRWQQTARPAAAQPNAQAAELGDHNAQHRGAQAE